MPDVRGKLIQYGLRCGIAALTSPKHREANPSLRPVENILESFNNC
jgi:hypothetical protein